MNSGTKILPRLLLALLVLGIISYALFRVSPLVRGPEIVILEPQDGETIDADFADLKIQTKRVSELFVNNQPIFINADGTTLYRLYLQSGISVIQVDAFDIYGTQKNSLFSVLKSGESSVNLDQSQTAIER